MKSDIKKNHPQIFLSYAQEDREKVIELYNKLKRAGFSPWMDVKDLFPGKLWEEKIEEAIKKSHFFIACLSNKSVQKRGVIQKEIRIALDLWKEKLDSDIYLLPVRFDDCEVPEKLKKYQWIDLFDNFQENFERLKEAIKIGWKRLGNTFDNDVKEIDNLLLFKNNLLHLEYELEQEEINFLRIIKETHLALYRAMIEALRGSANLAVIGKNEDPTYSLKYKFGNGPWLEIRKVIVKGCKKAWRYSQPVECEEPKEQLGRNVSTSESYLIDFFEALAKIQTVAYMGKYVYSKPVKISNKEMKIIEELNYYKNEFDYFIPKFLLASKYDIPYFLNPCFKIIKELIFNSGNVMPIYYPKDLENIIERILNKVNN